MLKKTKKKKTKPARKTTTARKAGGKVRLATTRTAQTPLALALGAKIQEVKAHMPPGGAIKSQAERKSFRNNGGTGRTLVQTVAALLSSGTLDLKVQLDPSAALTSIAHISAFWPLIAQMRDTASLLEDTLIREAGELGAATSRVAGVIVSHAKEDPKNGALADASKAIATARKVRDPLLPTQPRKAGVAKAGPKTTKSTRTTTTVITQNGAGAPDATTKPAATA